MQRRQVMDRPRPIRTMLAVAVLLTCALGTRCPQRLVAQTRPTRPPQQNVYPPQGQSFRQGQPANQNPAGMPPTYSGQRAPSQQAPYSGQTGVGQPHRGATGAADPRMQPGMAGPPPQYDPNRAGGDPRQGAPRQGAPRQGAPRQDIGRPPVHGASHAAAPGAATARAPFVLTPEEQQRLDAVLYAWEKRGEQVRSFTADFHRNVYDRAWGDPQNRGLLHTNQGRLRYDAPDHGVFEVFENEEGGDLPQKWICDGAAVYGFNFKEKQLEVTNLPPDLRGQAIVNSPLPFLFGAKADELKQRYWMRLKPSPQGATNELWIEAFPKYQADAANYRRVELILTADKLEPHAILLEHPGAQQQVTFLFENRKFNPPAPLRRIDPLNILSTDPYRVSTPAGWKRIEDPVATADQSGQQTGAPPRR